MPVVYIAYIHIYQYTYVCTCLFDQHVDPLGRGAAQLPWSAPTSVSTNTWLLPCVSGLPKMLLAKDDDSNACVCASVECVRECACAIVIVADMISK